MKKPEKFDLDIQSIQCTLEALDLVRETFDERSTVDGLSKKEFAEWIGKDPSYVSRVLNGRVSNVNFQTISRMLIALGYWPNIALADMEENERPSNYRLCDAATDEYIRCKSPWKVYSEVKPDFDYSKNATSRLTTING